MARTRTTARIPVGIILVALLGQLPAAETWYQITTEQVVDGSNYTYTGASPLSLNALTEAIAQDRPIRLERLVAWEDGAWVDWTEYQPESTGMVIIPARRILVILPLKGNPRTEQADPAGPSASAAAPAKPQDPGKL